jgi:hypothetical protein
MGFSLAALFGLGKKKEPKPVAADTRAADARQPASAPAPVEFAPSAKPGVSPMTSSPPGVAAGIRAYAAAVSKQDDRAAYAAAKALAELFKAQGRMRLSLKWALEAGEIVTAMAVASAPARTVAARAAVARALRSVETGKPLAAGPHAGVLKRICGLSAAAQMAGHGTWLSGLGFQAVVAVAYYGDDAEPAQAA